MIDEDLIIIFYWLTIKNCYQSIIKAILINKYFFILESIGSILFFLEKKIERNSWKYYLWNWVEHHIIYI